MVQRKRSNGLTKKGKRVNSYSVATDRADFILEDETTDSWKYIRRKARKTIKNSVKPDEVELLSNILGIGPDFQYSSLTEKRSRPGNVSIPSQEKT